MTNPLGDARNHPAHGAPGRGTRRPAGAFQPEGGCAHRRPAAIVTSMAVCANRRNPMLTPRSHRHQERPDEARARRMAWREGPRQTGSFPAPPAGADVPHGDRAVGGDRGPATRPGYGDTDGTEAGFGGRDAVRAYPMEPESSNRVWRRTADHPRKHCDSCELLIVAYGLDGAAAEQVRMHGQSSRAGGSSW